MSAEELPLSISVSIYLIKRRLKTSTSRCGSRNRFHSCHLSLCWKHQKSSTDQEGWGGGGGMILKIVREKDDCRRWLHTLLVPLPKLISGSTTVRVPSRQTRQNGLKFVKFTPALSQHIIFEFFVIRSHLHFKPGFTSRGFKKFQQKFAPVGIEFTTLTIMHHLQVEWVTETCATWHTFN